MPKLEVRNFMKARAVDIEITPPVTLVEGHNEAGKSSTWRAIAAVLTGVEMPIELPKARSGNLVQTGAKRASATLITDTGSRTITWPNPHVTTNGVPPTLRCSEYAAGLKEILTLKKEVKAEEFARILQADPTVDELKRALADRKIPQAEQDRVIATIYGIKEEITGRMIQQPRDYDFAHKEAVDTAKVLKRRWQDTAGIEWGSRQSEGWIPENWDASLSDRSEESLTAELTQARENLDGLNVHLGSDMERRRALESKVFDVPDYVAELAAATVVRDAAKVEYAAAQEKLDATPLPARAVELVQCGGCSMKGVIKGKALIKCDAPDPAEIKKATDTFNAARDAATLAKLALDRAQNEFNRYSIYIEELDRAEKELAALGPAEEVDSAAIEAARTAIKDAEQRLQAWLRKRNADQLHEQIKIQLQIAEVLAPQGLRLIALNKAISDLNARLRKLTDVAGWGAVHITPDLNAEYENWDYVLLAESAQWRVDVCLRVAIAQMDGSDIVLIDRGDRLDKDNRRGLTLMLVDCGITAIVFRMGNRDEMPPDLAKAGRGASYRIVDGVSEKVGV